ncbi:YtxH domain-containing protein [Pseudalkalibacillus caeni]|uniref:YtxH domain-containing protein n=1 Tax=Exobacillus caeni TaxID=2574798 RepID=A0A5R9F7S2_9BACL|nr:YtxH domain-containing protein [Pseudalkalibacillus caeni]TLS39081.1 YtxH domain-containing protein [Pseudalkalibacillus caeni]
MSENNQNNINTKDFLIGSLIGGIVGAATALLMAPKSGKELRSDINEQASVVKDKTMQFRETAMEKGTEFANRAKDKSSSVYKQVSDQSSNVINKIKETRDNMKNNADSEDSYDEMLDQADQDVEKFQEDLGRDLTEDNNEYVNAPDK